MKTKFKLPDIPEAEQTPVVKGLLAIIEQLIEYSQKQQEEIEVLKDEILLLKGEKKRPKFKPSKLDESTNVESNEKPDKNNNQTNKSGKNNSPKKGKQKRGNKRDLPVDREVRIKPDQIPEGSRYKGTRDFNVQELVIKNENVLYRLEHGVFQASCRLKFKFMPPYSLLSRIFLFQDSSKPL